MRSPVKIFYKSQELQTYPEIGDDKQQLALIMRLGKMF